MWTPDAFLEQIYDRTPDYSFKSGTYAEWGKWRPALVNALKKAIVLPIGDAVDPNPVVLGREDCGAYIREHILLATAPHLTMPCYLLIPKNAVAPYPAVIACPGHGYGYKQLIGLLSDGSRRPGEPGIYKDYPLELVNRGMLVIIPELLGLGDRRLEQDRTKEPTENSCFPLAMNLLMAGKTLAGYRVHEMICCVDYLLSRSDAVPGRIGSMGFSGGGLVTALAAAIDERIGPVVISGYTNTFRGSILAKPHCSDNYIPGLLQYAEMPDIWGLIAPRPLLIEAGRGDSGFPIQGALKGIEHLRSIYHAANAEEKLHQDIHSGKHEVSGRIAFDWLEAQLV